MNTQASSNVRIVFTFTSAISTFSNEKYGDNNITWPIYAMGQWSGQLEH